MKRYFLKYNVATGELILDSTDEKTSVDEFLVVQNKLTEEQAKSLKERLTGRFLRKGRKPFFSEVEFEFERIFHICKSCGIVSYKKDISKAWKDECENCFRENEQLRKKEAQANRDYFRKIRKYRLHLQTIQGQIDAVPMEIIESNVRLELKLQGKMITELADSLQMSSRQVWSLFKKKSIRKEHLFLISEFLFVPIEKLLRKPKGYKIPYKDGVPEFWLKNNFRVRYYDESIPKRI